jgi:hypothetical protein
VKKAIALPFCVASACREVMSYDWISEIARRSQVLRMICGQLRMLASLYDALCDVCTHFWPLNRIIS